MAKITIKELYYGDKYAVMSEVFKTMFLASPNKAGVDEQTALELEIVRQTLIAVKKWKRTVTVLPRVNSGMRSPFLYAEVLMKAIDELWYGNISPFEQCTRGDKRLKELLKLVVRNREELDGSLTEKQKETLEKFEDCMNEMHSITERDAFSYGFRLGVQLMAEAFLEPLSED